MTVHSQPGLHFQPVGGHAVKGAKQAVEAGQDAQVLSQIIQMALFHNPWGHIAVGDALIAHNSGGEPVVEVHPGQPLHIESGNSIVAFPQLLQCLGGHGLKGRKKLLCLRQELGQSIHRKAVHIHIHFFGRSQYDPHGDLLPERPFGLIVW